MTRTENKTSTNRLLFFLLLGFAVILALNLVAVSYPFFIVLPMLKALGLVLVNAIYGFALMRLFGKKGEETIHFVFAFALGLIVTSCFFFLLGMFKLLVTPFILLYFLMPLPILWWILQKQKRIFLDTLQNFLHRPAIEYLVFLFPLIYASLPTIHYETLTYYLGFPNLYLQNNGFVATPSLLSHHTFIYSEVLYIPPVFAGEMVPQLFHWLLGLILTLAVIDFAVDYFKITKRNILLLTIVSLSTLVFLITRVNNDLAGTLFVFLGIVCYLKDKKHLSALFWGFALGLQFLNILPLTLFLLMQMIVAIEKKRLGTFWKQMVFFGLILFAILTPLLVKNVFAGHPLFHLSFVSEDSGSWAKIGILFVLFLPLLFFIKMERKYTHLLFFSLANVVLPDIRGWYIAFILLAIYVVLAYESLEGRTRHIFTTLFFIVVGLNTFFIFGQLEHLTRSHELYTGKVGIEEYKSQNCPTYKAIAFVNNNTPPDARILMVGETRSYDLKRPYKVSSVYNHDTVKKYLEKSLSQKEFANTLKVNRIDYIIFDGNEFSRVQHFFQSLTPAEYQQALTYFKGLPILFHEGEVFVFASD